MTTFNVRSKYKDEDYQIFANRNSRMKRYPHMPINDCSVETHEQPHKQSSTFMLFKDRLATYIENQRGRDQLNVNRMVFWNKPRQNTQNKKISAKEQVPQAINPSKKQSILRNLRRSCNRAVQRQKSFEGQFNLNKQRIHANVNEARKKSYTESSAWQESQKNTEGMAWLQKNHSVPICTINYFGRKRQQQHKTVYNCYLNKKMGVDNLNFEGTKRKTQYNYVPLCLSKERLNWTSEGHLTQDRRHSEVLIFQKPELNNDYYRNKAEQLIDGGKKFRKTKKGTMIKIGRSRDHENLVGPWSRMMDEQDEEHFLS